MRQEASYIDELLAAWAAGDKSAPGELVKTLYPELRRLAVSLGRSASGEIALEADALVNELYLKLVKQEHIPKNRYGFLEFASLLLRRLWVERAKRNIMRGAPALYFSDERAAALRPWDEHAADPSGRLIDVLSLDRALAELAAVDPRAGKVVELRFFAGLHLSEVAEVLGVSRATVSRDWEVAKVWLRGKLAAKVEIESHNEISRVLDELEDGFSEATRQLMKLEAKLDAALGEPYA